MATDAIKAKHVSVSECLSIAETLDCLLKPSFGPNALHNLLSTATGKLLITCSGRDVLQSLRLSHPLGFHLVSATVALHNLTGDNTKTFIAIITDVLRQLDKHLRVGGPNRKSEASERLSIVRALGEVKREVLPAVQGQLVSVCNASVAHRCIGYTQALELCSDVIWTCLQGRFNTETRKMLVRLSSELLSKYSHDLPNALQAIVAEFDVICVDSPGQSVLNSCILYGVVIQRAFLPGCAPVDLPLRDIAFVILNCSLESLCPLESNTRIKLISQEQSKDSLQWKLSRIQRMAVVLKSHGVQLIITPEFVSQSTALVFIQEGIFIAHSVGEEDVTHLSNVGGIYLICDDSEIASSCNIDGLIGHALRVDTVVVGGRSFILIQFAQDSASSVHHIQHSIRLCAPTTGTCDQFAAAVLCGFKAALLAVCPERYIDLDQKSIGNAERCDVKRFEDGIAGSDFSSEAMTSSGDVTFVVSNSDSSGAMFCFEDRAFAESNFTLKAIVCLEGQTFVGSHSASSEVMACPEDWELIESNSASETIVCPKDGVGLPIVRAMVCPGGGAFERSAHKILKEHASSLSQHVNVSLICNILAKALLSVPHRLLQNSYRLQTNGTSIMKLCELMRVNITEESPTEDDDPLLKPSTKAPECRGLDARSGQGILGDPRIIEPLASKLLMLYSVLDVLHQILRIDYLVPVSSIPKDEDEDSTSDSDD